MKNKYSPFILDIFMIDFRNAIMKAEFGPTLTCRKYFPVSLYCNLVNMKLYVPDLYTTKARVLNIFLPTLVTRGVPEVVFHLQINASVMAVVTLKYKLAS